MNNVVLCSITKCNFVFSVDLRDLPEISVLYSDIYYMITHFLSMIIPGCVRGRGVTTLPSDYLMELACLFIMPCPARRRCLRFKERALLELLSDYGARILCDSENDATCSSLGMKCVRDKRCLSVSCRCTSGVSRAPSPSPLPTTITTIMPIAPAHRPPAANLTGIPLLNKCSVAALGYSAGRR